MGYNKSKRPLLAPGIAVFDGSFAGATGPATLSGDLDVSGDLRAGGSLTLAQGLTMPTESLTASTVLQTLSAYGVSFITMASSGAGRDFRLPAPPAAGAVKYVYVSNNTTSIDTVIFSNGTANTFYGTTFNQAALAAASTGSPGGTPDGSVGLICIGASTAVWTVTAFGSTNWSFSASTGSTGQ